MLHITCAFQKHCMGANGKMIPKAEDYEAERNTEQQLRPRRCGVTVALHNHRILRVEGTCVGCGVQPRCPGLVTQSR